jgi:hypothetical protein
MNAFRKFSSLAIGVLSVVGCGTSSEDVHRAQNDFRDAETFADQKLADAGNNANEYVHATRGMNLDATSHVIETVEQDEEESATRFNKEGSELNETNREDRKELAGAEPENAKKIADVTREAAEEIATAKQQLDTLRKAAIRNAKDAFRKQERAVRKKEREVADAREKMNVAEMRLRSATDENRREMQKGLDDARATLANEQAELTEARHDVNRKKMELHTAMAPAL